MEQTLGTGQGRFLPEVVRCECGTIVTPWRLSDGVRFCEKCACRKCGGQIELNRRRNDRDLCLSCQLSKDQLDVRVRNTRRRTKNHH